MYIYVWVKSQKKIVSLPKGYHLVAFQLIITPTAYSKMLFTAISCQNKKFTSQPRSRSLCQQFQDELICGDSSNETYLDYLCKFFTPQRVLLNTNKNCRFTNFPPNSRVKKGCPNFCWDHFQEFINIWVVAHIAK